MNSKIYLRLWLIYVIFLFYGCTVPFNINSSASDIMLKINGIFWNPYLPPKGLTYSKIDMASNILLYLPFGFLLASHFKKKLSVCAILIISTLSSLSVSALIETIQLFTVDRVTSTTDICNNFAGSISGSVFSLVYHKRFHNKVKSFLMRIMAKPPLELYSIIIIFGIIFFRLIPFDISSDVDNIKHNIKFFIKHTNIIPTTETIHGSINNLLLFSISAFALFTGYFRGKNYLLRLFFALGINSLVLFATEFVKIFIISGQPAVCDISFSYIGSFLGIFTATFFINDNYPIRKIFAYFVIVYAVFFIFNYLYPFEFSPQIREKLSFYSLIPFAIYLFNINPANISDIFLQIFMFVPIGIILIRNDKTSIMKSFFAGFVCGLLFEIIQLFIVTRYFDITDAILAAAGTSIGHYCHVNFRRIKRFSENNAV